MSKEDTQVHREQRQHRRYVEVEQLAAAGQVEGVAEREQRGDQVAGPTLPVSRPQPQYGQDREASADQQQSGPWAASCLATDAGTRSAHWGPVRFNCHQML